MLNTVVEGNVDTAQIVQEHEKDIDLKSRNKGVDEIMKKHKKRLSKYSFLSGVIQIYCPLLYPELPYHELRLSGAVLIWHHFNHGYFK